MSNNYAQIARRLERLRDRLPVLIGDVIISFALDNFEKQGFDTGRGIRKWDDRENDFEPDRAILVGSRGNASQGLMRSIRRTRATRNQVVVGSNLEYAGIHNEGGQIRVSVTAKSRRFFWAMHYATGEKYWKNMALTKKKQLTINIPERRFLGNSEELDRRVLKLLEQELEKAYR